MADQPKGPKRNAQGQFIERYPAKGTGRPGGVVGLARAIRARDKGDGKSESALMDFCWDVWEGKIEMFNNSADRKWAWEKIMNRGYGKEVDVSVLLPADSTASPLTDFSTEQLRALILQRASGNTPALPQPVDAELVASEPTADDTEPV